MYIKNLIVFLVGAYDIKFIPDYKRLANDPPEDIIKIYGSDDSFGGGKSFYMKTIGMRNKKRFDSSGVLTFHLDKDMDDIVNWLNGTSGKRIITKEDPLGEEDWNENEEPKKSELEDYLDNFDAYNGEGSIDPTKDAPYEFIDSD